MCKKYLDVIIIKLSMQNFIIGMDVRERNEYNTTTSFQIYDGKGHPLILAT
jgi:hypothetical protein